MILLALLRLREDLRRVVERPDPHYWCWTQGVTLGVTPGVTLGAAGGAYAGSRCSRSHIFRGQERGDLFCITFLLYFGIRLSKYLILFYSNRPRVFFFVKTGVSRVIKRTLITNSSFVYCSPAIKTRLLCCSLLKPSLNGNLVISGR